MMKKKERKKKKMENCDTCAERISFLYFVLLIGFDKSKLLFTFERSYFVGVWSLTILNAVLETNCEG